jgi:hypothetical protein
LPPSGAGEDHLTYST